MVRVPAYEKRSAKQVLSDVIIKGRPLEVDFDRRINVYNKERPHE
jgi:hypothetical protein